MAKINEFVVIGFKRVDYTKKNGTGVHGCEVYLSPVTPDDGVVGQQTEAVYLSDGYASYVPNLEDLVRKNYNRFGRVEDLIPIR